MDEKKYIVYKHTSPSNKVYIGITCQKANQRWRNGKGYKDNIRFTNSIKYYGWDNFKHEILFENLTKEEAEKKEIEMISLYKSSKRKYGYNVSEGGGLKAEETIQKISAALKGRKLSPEAVQRLREINSGENNPMYGKPRSEETKRKISESNKGKKLSEEQKKQISEFQTGRKLPEATRRKMSESHKGEKAYWYGKRLTEETRKKLSESHKGQASSMKGKHHTLESLKKISKPVLCVETQTIYYSMQEAGRKTKASESKISECCRGNRKTAGGYHWEYANKEG